MSISSILKDLRLSEYLTQKELAKKINVGQSTIAQYENSEREPTLTNLIKYSNYFKISIDEILGLEELTAEEIEAGASKFKRKLLSPAEDELIFLFREVGKKHGLSLQQSIIDLTRSLLNK